MQHSVGVFICRCGPNIADKIPLERLEAACRQIDGVAAVETFDTFCSQDGVALISQRIREQGLTHVVVAGCSPREHEATFRRALAAASLNPYLLQVANIREQCAWVTPDSEDAGDKATALVRAAVQRVLSHDPLQEKAIEICPDVLVVGAGVAGISAALGMAQEGRVVYLVDNSLCIGGHAALYSDLFPELSCASCAVAPMLDRVLHTDGIEVMTGCEIVGMTGSYGNFTVSVVVRGRGVDPTLCLGCGQCTEACPVQTGGIRDDAHASRKAIGVAYPGALPNVAAIDPKACLRARGEQCTLCRDACPFGAVTLNTEDEARRLRVGSVVLATGFALYDPTRTQRFPAGQLAGIVSALAFERMVNPDGPTDGRILGGDGTPPGRIVFVHCAGSRSADGLAHCSGVCCMVQLKLAHQARQQLPEARITNLFADLCLPVAEGQPFFQRVRDADRVVFAQMAAPEAVIVEVHGDTGAVRLRYRTPSGENRTLEADLVVLAAGMTGAHGAAGLADRFGITVSGSDFFQSEDARLTPVATPHRGVYIAGCCQGPKDIPASIAQGQAAAGRVLQQLVPGSTIAIEPMVAEVDPDRCSGCGACAALCEFSAARLEGDPAVSAIDDTLCRGCGTCAAACPSGAIRCRHYSDETLCEEIRGLGVIGGKGAAR